MPVAAPPSHKRLVWSPRARRARVRAPLDDSLSADLSAPRSPSRAQHVKAAYEAHGGGRASTYGTMPHQRTSLYEAVASGVRGRAADQIEEQKLKAEAMCAPQPVELVAPMMLSPAPRSRRRAGNATRPPPPLPALACAHCT